MTALAQAPRPDETDHYTVAAEQHEVRSPKWIDERRTYVGASEVPILMGAVSGEWGSPFALQAEKLGLDRLTEENPMMKWGTLKEPLILQEFGRELGQVVASYQYGLRSKRYPFLGCTPDGLLMPLGAGAAPGFVQAKNSAGFGDAWEMTAEGRMKPERVWIQVQAEMAVTGDPWEYVVGLIRGYDLRWARIDRDEEFIRDTMIPAVEEFHMACEAEEMLPTDSTVSCRRVLEKLFPPDRVLQKEIALPATFVDADEHYADLMHQKKDIDHQLEAIRNEARSLIGEHPRGNVPNGAYWNWRPTPAHSRPAVEIKEGRRLQRYKGTSEE